MILDKYFLEQATISSSRPVHSATSCCSDCVYAWGTLSPPSHSPCCQLTEFLSGAVAKTVLVDDGFPAASRCARNVCQLAGARLCAAIKSFESAA